MRTMIRELCLTAATLAVLAGPALAKNVKVDMTVKEVELEVDNKGTRQKMWTYDGTIPGPGTGRVPGGPPGSPPRRRFRPSSSNRP